MFVFYSRQRVWPNKTRSMLRSSMMGTNPLISNLEDMNHCAHRPASFTQWLPWTSIYNAAQQQWKKKKKILTRVHSLWRKHCGVTHLKCSPPWLQQLAVWPRSQHVPLHVRLCKKPPLWIGRAAEPYQSYGRWGRMCGFLLFCFVFRKAGKWESSPIRQQQGLLEITVLRSINVLRDLSYEQDTIFLLELFVPYNRREGIVQGRACTLCVSFYPDDTKAADFSSRGHNYITYNKFERSGTRELLPSKALTVS